MDCSRNEFFSVIEPWCGKRCLVIVESEFVRVRALFVLKTVSADLRLTFANDDASDIALDLSVCSSFEFGDAREAPPEAQETVGAGFESLAFAKAPGKILAMIFLPRIELE